MFNSGILDVAIGLIFIYLLLSLICTAISELIESKLKMRAVDLERGIRELLRQDTDVSLVQKFYAHPLIYGLFSDSYDPSKIDPKSHCYKSGSNLPSYIPSRSFALALMDLILPANNAPAPSSNPLAPLLNSINAMTNTQVKGALLPLVTAAGQDIGKARENIEAWYNSTMERVSGWYKRRSQWTAFWLGLGIAIAFNADTITISRSLSTDAAMRSYLVAAAQEYAKTDVSAPSPDAKVQIAPGKKDENPPERRAVRNLDELKNLGLPLGWNPKDARTIPSFPSLDWLTKLLGWLLTAIALSLGAPFWFDILNKFIVVRSTIKPREKSPEEPVVNR